MKPFAQKMTLILRPKCEQVRLLSSEALDRPLTWHEVLAIRIHRCMCWSCRQFARQLKFLRQSVAQLAQQQERELEEVQLSEECKARLKSLRP